MRPRATNPDARAWNAPDGLRTAHAFHRSIPGYAATPLVAVQPGVWVKDESDRFGLPAFKVLGASWATNVAVSAHLGLEPAATFAELAERDGDVTLVTATDGNHGRALAWVARRLGLGARIYVAGGLPDTTIQAIRDEGAEVVETNRIYDDAVRMAADSGDLLIQDTAWPGYEDVPRAIVTGYGTLFAEIDEQLEPDLVVVPTGVGSLLQAALELYRRPDGPRPVVLAVEPVTAACVTASLAAGEPISVDTSAPTIMAGLNCGTVSSIAWPAVRGGLDAAVGVTDEETRAAMRELHAAGLAAGPCGAAAFAGYKAAGLPAAKAVLVSTEGIAANAA